MESEISIVGCGWLGLPLARRLIEKGYRVRGSTTREARLSLLSENGVEAYLFHLSPERTATTFPEELFQSRVIILTLPPERKSAPGQDTYPEMIGNLVSRLAGTPVRKVIFISSTSVYPDVNGIVSEDEPLMASTSGGRSLIEAEKVLNAAKGIQTTILRLAGLAGPGRYPGGWFQGRKDLPGGDSFVNLIHLEDCIGIILAIIEQGHWDKTFHAAAPMHPRKRDYYPIMTAKMGLIPPEFGVEGSGGGKIIDPSRLIRELNYCFIYPDPYLF